MKLHLTSTNNLNIFTAHGPGYVQIRDQRISQPCIVMPDKIDTDWVAQSFGTLKESDFEYLLALKPEIVILGSGSRIQFAPAGLYRCLISAGIGVEFMDTPAACRTYNILTGEERRVAAGILFD